MPKKIKVLIVEDEESLSQMYAIKFEKEGFDVETALDGEVALEKALTVKPDFILLDVILPKIDGFSVLEKIREDSKLDKVPVVMLTNLGQTEDHEKGEKLGADDYLVKANCTPMEVVAKVKEVLDKKKVKKSAKKTEKKK